MGRGEPIGYTPGMWSLERGGKVMLGRRSDMVRQVSTRSMATVVDYGSTRSLHGVQVESWELGAGMEETEKESQTGGMALMYGCMATPRWRQEVESGCLITP